MRNILCDVCRPIQILFAKVWQRNLDYVKILQAKYFTSENIPIYGNYEHLHVHVHLNVAICC